MKEMNHFLMILHIQMNSLKMEREKERLKGLRLEMHPIDEDMMELTSYDIQEMVLIEVEEWCTCEEWKEKKKEEENEEEEEEEEEKKMESSLKWRHLQKKEK